MLQEELVARGGKEGGRPPIYNTERMHEILEEIGWTEQQPWAETQAITLDDEEIGKPWQFASVKGQRRHFIEKESPTAPRIGCRRTFSILSLSLSLLFHCFRQGPRGQGG